jgi:hypothetical protein
LIVLFFFAPSNGSLCEPFLFYGCARHSFILVSFFAPFSSQLCCAIVFDFAALKRALNWLRQPQEGLFLFLRFKRL